ncbi:Hypothetical_protein [Hexamita inflata]|uniref:Hypothetical_protein n=1 Tax=Hexamita inflata TaxID=28002 RepID=A0AA86PPV7_9EUKA|nr:Hypothetical protein HINF_LOCUS31161 [Hexamita inflata]
MIDTISIDRRQSITDVSPKRCTLEQGLFVSENILNKSGINLLQRFKHFSVSRFTSKNFKPINTNFISIIHSSSKTSLNVNTIYNEAQRRVWWDVAGLLGSVPAQISQFK